MTLFAFMDHSYVHLSMVVFKTRHQAFADSVTNTLNEKRDLLRRCQDGRAAPVDCDDSNTMAIMDAEIRCTLRNCM